MNTRQAIQTSNQPAVLNVAFSESRSRFITGLAEGCRIFRTDNCLTTYQPILSESSATKSLASPASLVDAGIGIAAVLDDRYFAVVGGGRSPQANPNVFAFWDATSGKQVCEFDLHEKILGLRLSSRHAAVILAQRTVLFEYQQLGIQQPTPPASPAAGAPARYAEMVADVQGPNKVRAVLPTALNLFALGCMGKSNLVLPAQSVGQVQIVPLPEGSKRVLRAHTTALRCIVLSDDESLLATASVQGTLIRIFNTKTLDQVAEFRRGVDHAVVTSLAISPENRWLACTSDKGTLHVFDMKPGSITTAGGALQPPELKTQHRKSQSYSDHRFNVGALDKESVSGMSGRSRPSSPGYQGSIQEYYGLRPPPTSASPTGQQAAVSALQAFRNSSLAPRVLKDVRSVASAPFHIGNDPQYWQGGSSSSWTTAPNGHRKRVNQPIPPLPDDPSGRPPKGIVAFAPRDSKGLVKSNTTSYGVSNITRDDEGAAMFVIGGGSDPKWELFELLPADNGSWVLVRQGFRNYLTPQFVR